MVKEKMPHKKFISKVYKTTRSFFKVYFKKIVLLITFIAFISISVFSHHTHHDEDLQIKNYTAHCLKVQSASLQDKDGDFCIACFWQSIAQSTGIFDKIVLPYENPVQNIFKPSLKFHSEKIILSFQNRAPPARVSAGC